MKSIIVAVVCCKARDLYSRWLALANDQTRKEPYHGNP